METVVMEGEAVEGGKTKRSKSASPVSPTPDELLRLLQVMPSSTYRFLTSEYPEDYSAIAFVLYWNRRFGSNEVHHEDLRREAEALTIALTGRDLPEARFQPMLDNLYGWGVLDRRVATQSIRSIHDWRRNYGQYWITDDAHRLFSLLEYGQGLRERRISSAEGRDFVRILDERLEEIVSKLNALPIAKTEATALARNEELRQLYQTLNLLHTTEFHQFKDFLSQLNSALIEFGRRPDVNLDTE